MNDIYFFNIRTRESEKVDIKPLLNNGLKDNIKEEYKSIGIKITFIEDAETFIKAYFEYKGYKVLKCSPTNSNDDEIFGYDPSINEDKKAIFEYIERHFQFFDKLKNEYILPHLNKSGLTDLVVYRKEHK